MKDQTQKSGQETGPTILGTRIRFDPPHTPLPHKNSVFPSPGIDDVVTWIRQEVNRQQTTMPAAERESAGTNQKPFSLKQEAQWNRIRANLNLAEENALAGTILPELGRFRGATRKLARVMARGLLYFGRVITNSQRKFNVAALAAVRDLHYLFHQAEQTRHEQADLGGQTLVDLMERCRRLERQVAELSARLDSDHRPPTQMDSAKQGEA
jgi:hypothetical protein